MTVPIMHCYVTDLAYENDIHVPKVVDDPTNLTKCSFYDIKIKQMYRSFSNSEGLDYIRIHPDVL